MARPRFAPRRTVALRDRAAIHAGPDMAPHTPTLRAPAEPWRFAIARPFTRAPIWPPTPPTLRAPAEPWRFAIARPFTRAPYGPPYPPASRPGGAVALRDRATASSTARFLPTTRAEMDARGWAQLDILIVTGDAYVDHPAFGAGADRALPRGARLQGRASSRSPTGDTRRDLPALGAAAPVRRHHAPATSTRCSTSSPRRRRCAARISTRPGGRTGMRPEPRDASSTRNLLPPGVPRRADRARRHRGVAAPHRALRLLVATQVRRSILLDAKADLLVFGMGERPVWEVAERLRARRADRARSATCAAPRS